MQRNIFANSAKDGTMFCSCALNPGFKDCFSSPFAATSAIACGCRMIRSVDNRIVDGLVVYGVISGCRDW